MSFTKYDYEIKDGELFIKNKKSKYWQRVRLIV